MQVPFGMRHGHFTGFRRMLVVVMATCSTNIAPSVRFQFSNQIARILCHESIRSIGRKTFHHYFTALKTKIGHDVSALVLDYIGATRALQRLLGFFIAERRGLLVIRLGGG